MKRVMLLEGATESPFFLEATRKRLKSELRAMKQVVRVAREINAAYGTMTYSKSLTDALKNLDHVLEGKL